MRKASNDCVEMIKRFEGFRERPYKVSSNEAYYTIGYGHYGIKNPNMIIDEATATSFLNEDLNRCYENIAPYDSKYHFTNNEYDALVSFCYNIGSIDQLTQYGERSKDEMANAILKYVYCGDTKLEGLIKRREAEHNLYVNAVFPDGKKSEATNNIDKLHIATISEDTTIKEIVDLVLNGDFGNGDMRKEKLYDVIQSFVNHRLGVE